MDVKFQNDLGHISGLKESSPTSELELSIKFSKDQVRSKEMTVCLPKEEKAVINKKQLPLL